MWSCQPRDTLEESEQRYDMDGAHDSRIPVTIVIGTLAVTSTISLLGAAAVSMSSGGASSSKSMLT